MKKYSKILVSLFLVFFTFLLKLETIDAASCRIGVSAPSNVVVGRTFNVTVTVSGGAPIGSWEYTLGYDSSKVRLNSGQLHIVDYGNGSKKSASYSYSFTALKSGVASFKPTNASVLDYSSTNECLSSTGLASVTMKTQAEIEAGYSRNNNLASLSVEGAELTPVFNKDVLEYSVTLPVDTTKAIINASTEDKTATIQGIGEVDVVDGINKFEIKVTAQHGEVKTYIVNITVEELDPIKVKIGNKNYTVIRKPGQIESIPQGFAETKIKIGEQDITAYKSDVTKLTLVGLKDEEGKAMLFIYNAASNEYKEFNEAKSNGASLVILNNDKVPSIDYEKAEFTYNNTKVSGYKLIDGSDKNYVVYAKNLLTGNEDYYLYDKQEGIFQRYYIEYDEYKNKQLEILFYIAASLAGLLLLIILVLIVRKLFTSKEKKIRRYQRKIDRLKKKLNKAFEEEGYEETYDLSKLSDKPEIKKIEDNEYVIPRKSKKEKLREIKEAKEKLDMSRSSYRRVSLEDDE